MWGEEGTEGGSAALLGGEGGHGRWCLRGPSSQDLMVECPGLLDSLGGPGCLEPPFPSL